MDDAKMRVMASLGNMSGQPLLLSTGFPQKLAGSYFGRGQSAQTDKEKEALIRMEQGLPPEKTPEEIQQEQQQQPQQKQSMSQGRMMAELPPDMRSQSGSVDQERARAQESLRIQQEMDAQRRMNEERARQEQMRRRT